MFSSPRMLALLGALGTQVVIVNTAMAEQSSAVLTGTVVNAESNQGVEGVAVVVTSPSMQGEEMVVSDGTGHYRIPNLPPGVYQVAVFKKGFREYKRENITLLANQTIRVNMKIIPEASKMERRQIVVTSPTVDVGSSKTGMNITQDFQRRVPVIAPGGKGGANRSFESAAVATPGAKADTYGTSISGTTSPENGYTIDGLTVGNPAFGLNGTPLSSEFVGEINVISGGYMPEYGRAIGGQIDAVTKTGSNEFHGGVWMYFTPGALQGTRKQVVRAGSTAVTNDRIRYEGDVGFDIGGRIIKDKLWFYAGFDIARSEYALDYSLNAIKFDDDGNPEDERVVIPGTPETFIAQGTAIQALLKFTLRPAKNHKISLTGIVAPTFSGGNGTFGINPRTGGPETTNIVGDFNAIAHRFTGTPVTLGLKWLASTDSKKINFDTKIGWAHETIRRLPNDGSGIGNMDPKVQSGQPGIIWRRSRPYPHSIGEFVDLNEAGEELCEPIEMEDEDTGEVTRLDPCPAQTWRTGGPGFINEQTTDRVQARHVVSFDFQGGGHHTLKTGVDFEYDQFDHNKMYSGGVFLREGVTGTSFQDYRKYGFLAGPGEPRHLNTLGWTTRFIIAGAFLQDSWAIADKVTLNAGVRFDSQVVYGGGGEVVLSLSDQWSPRVGLIWDPTQKGHSRIYANYARFYQIASLDLADRAGSVEARIISYHTAGDGACNPLEDEDQGATDGCRGDDTRIDLHDPGNVDGQWYSGGGKTPVDPDIKSQSSDELVVGGDYEIFKNARLGVSYKKRWMNRIIEDMSRDEATTYFLGNPGEGIAKDFPEGVRNYDEIVLIFDKAWADNWLLNASYTLSWLRGNFAGLFRPETGQLDPNINSDFDLISLLPNRIGWLPGDRRHVIKLFSAGAINIGRKFGIDLGGVITVQSGGPTNYYGSHEIYGGNEVFVLPRGSGERLPWTFQLDAKLGFRWQINKSTKLEFTADVFNLLNLQTETARDSTWTNEDVLPVQDCGNAEPKNDPACLQGEGLLSLATGDPATKNPNFGNPVRYQNPMQWRFGLRFSY